MGALKVKHAWHQCQCGCIFDADTLICPVYHKDGMPSLAKVLLTLEEVWAKRSGVWTKYYADFEPLFESQRNSSSNGSEGVS